MLEIAIMTVKNRNRPSVWALGSTLSFVIVIPLPHGQVGK